ncbi:hypothetical protein J6590_079342 [Homalodisca vitripennis]|nr:hypothetical protein J6590_079342 [Homalodisca vitripennis]
MFIGEVQTILKTDWCIHRLSKDVCVHVVYLVAFCSVLLVQQCYQLMWPIQQLLCFCLSISCDIDEEFGMYKSDVYEQR